MLPVGWIAGQAPSPQGAHFAEADFLRRLAIASQNHWALRTAAGVKNLLGDVKIRGEISRVPKVFRKSGQIEIILLLVTNSSKSKIAYSMNYEALFV